MNRILSCFCMIMLLSCGAQAQSFIQRTKRLPLQPRMVLDTLTILYQSIEIRDTFGQTLPLSFQLQDTLLLVDSLHFIDDTLMLPRIVDISYSVLPFRLGQKYQLIDSTHLASSKEAELSSYKYVITPDNPNKSIGSKGLDYEGSFSRGISFGNAQNLIYDAAFNLQMAGTIGDSIFLRAAISDNQIPLQPEGNTQKIQEFDRIFIEISKGSHRLLAGDFDLRPSGSYFMQYFKKFKGLSYRFKDTFDPNTKIESQFSAAISRGRFQRQTIVIKEGNQGPYKLIGKQNERFIIVIAGSEKIYLDGKLLERGRDKNYIIDYNLGEITFTTYTPINAYSRIYVEFEYQDQQYSRSLLSNRTSIEWKKMKSYINIYHQQDSKTPSINFGTTLDSVTLSELQMLPEQKGQVFVPGIRSINDQTPEQEIRYTLKDTFYFVNGVRYDTIILLHQFKPASGTQVTSKFSEVGLNQGDYVIQQGASNGRVYQWVAPNAQTGSQQGNYAPVIRITPPITQQMIEWGISAPLSPRLDWSTDWAMSNLDLNRYSSNYESNDVGTAIKTKLNYHRKIVKEWQLKSSLNYEFRGRDFSIIEPYRVREFTRDWNLTNVPQGSEHLPTFDVEISRSKQESIRYTYEGLIRAKNYSGQRHNWFLSLQSVGWQIEGSGNYLTTSTQKENSAYLKPAITIRKQIPTWDNTVIGFTGWAENNRRTGSTSDTLMGTSFYFYELSPFLEKTLNKKWRYNFKYTYRNDQIASKSQFVPLTRANNFILTTLWKPLKRTSVNAVFNYRSLLVDNTEKTTLDNTKTLLGKTTLNSSLFKGGLKWNTRYEVSSGQEPRSEFVFAEVRAGQGNYIFTDFNMDDSPQYNEYTLAPYADTANFIKVRLFNNEYIRTDQVILEQSIVIDPRQPIRDNKKALPEWYNWTWRTTYKSSQKTTEANISQAWNPLATGLNDSNLITDFSLFNSLFIFHPSDELYDIQIKITDRRSKQILTTGYEAQQNQDYSIKSRWNLHRSLDWRLEAGKIRQWADSQNFDDRDYNITGLLFKSSINYRWKSRFRASGKYAYSVKNNSTIESNKAVAQNFILESTFKHSSKHAFNLNLTYAQVYYNGQRGTALELVILNGLKPGGNYIWNIRYNRKISSSVFLNISYNGRKTGSSSIFHTGSVQMRAIF